MDSHGTRRATQRPLIEGNRMRCPRCKVPQNILSFDRFDTVEEYEDETNPVLRCPRCRWVFSPGPSSEELRRLLDAMLDAGAELGRNERRELARV